ncbi:unnamed protein product, partial [Polarella glacialis]
MDDPELLLARVESLLSYACRSQFILIPVFPEPTAVQAFRKAEHPMDLLDYGERGWCRLEAYVFLCLGEITGEAVSCCGYGLLFQCRVDGDGDFNEELETEGTSQSCLGFTSSYEQLKPLMSGAATHFKREQLPSSGKLTAESDRTVIRATEKRIQNVYCRYAILSATEGHLTDRKRTHFVMDAKQLSCAHMPLLITELRRIQSDNKLRKLALRGNQLHCLGVLQLLRGVVCQEGSELEELDLQDNQLGDGAAVRQDAVGAVESGPCARCNLSSSRDAEALVEIAALLGSPSCAKLSVLKLSGNQLACSAAVIVQAG